MSQYTFPASAAYTPGDYTSPVRVAPATPASASVGQAPFAQGVTLPTWGLVAVIALLFFLEKRRIKRGL